MAKHLRLRKPARVALPGQRVSLGLKVSAEIKNRLDAAARQQGATQSQEAERRLEQTFRAEDRIENNLDFAFGRAMTGITLGLGYLLPVVGYVSILENGGSLLSASLHNLPLADWQPNFAAGEEVAAASDLFIRALMPGRSPPGRSPPGLADDTTAAREVRRLLTALVSPETLTDDPHLIEMAARVRERLPDDVLRRIQLRLERSQNPVSLS
jgi:hypothetical protein